MKGYLPLVACLLGLAGCATTVPTRLGPAAGTGLVYASLPGENATDSISVRAVSGSATYPLDVVYEGGSHVVESWLPPGDYKLDRWDGLAFGDYTSFHVEAGRITDLGALVPMAIGDYKFVVLPIRPTVGDSSLQAVQAEFASHLHDAPIEWRPTAPPHAIQRPQPSTGLGLIADLMMAYQRKVNRAPLRQQLAGAKSSQAFFDLAKASVPPTTQTALTDAKGDLLYGADLGQIRVRHPDASWTSIDSGVLATVTALARRDDLLVAGYDNGWIRASADGGKTWSAAATLASEEPVIDISWSGKRWLATTFGASKAVNVYASVGDAFGTFARIHQAFARWGFHIRGQLTQDAYYVNADPDLYRLDLESMQWNKVPTPTDVDGFNVSPNGDLLTVFHAKGIFSKLYLSTDKGASWKQYKAPPLVIDDMKFSDPTHGLAVRVRPNAFSVTVMLLRYQPGADEWSLLTQPPEECEHMIDDANGQPAFCIARGGAVLGQDAGKWRIESAAY
ncbi:hypothetical protein [Fulvimonas yonginensis]|uniref:Exo-alpha-sialidase n=1 Tax=Fulvimonas yonginensis TaxID=1495200 RepID=A0ABU8JFM6_9GAMM